MNLLDTVISGLIGILLVCVLASILFLLVYGILRLLHISVSWAIRITSAVLLAGSTAFSLFVMVQGSSLQALSSLQEPSNTMGFLSFLLLCYSLGQWVTRRWYLTIKKKSWATLIGFSRNILLVLRKHHLLFGWLVFATATAHMLAFIFLLIEQPQKDTKLVADVITGSVAWIMLLILMMLGLMANRANKHNVELKKLRWTHFVSAFVFTALVAVHVCFK